MKTKTKTTKGCARRQRRAKHEVDDGLKAGLEGLKAFATRRRKAVLDAYHDAVSEVIVETYGNLELSVGHRVDEDSLMPSALVLHDVVDACKPADQALNSLRSAITSLEEAGVSRATIASLLRAKARAVECEAPDYARLEAAIRLFWDDERGAHRKVFKRAFGESHVAARQSLFRARKSLGTADNAALIQLVVLRAIKRSIAKRRLAARICKEVAEAANRKLK